MNSLLELFNSLSRETKTAVLLAVVAVGVASKFLLGAGSKKAQIASAKAAKEPALNAKEYRKFKLREKQIINHNTRLYRFELPNHDDVLGLPIGQHISLRATIDGKEIYRSYTPVSSDEDRGYFDLLIKVYEKGQMTQYIDRMQVGDLLDVRGPKGLFLYKVGMCKHIGMIAGGTGITPMYQVAKAILKDTSDDTKMSLIFANVNDEDILLRKELEHMVEKYPHKFDLTYVLNNPPAGWTGGVGFVSQDMIKSKFAPPTEDVRVVMCGPPAMNKAMQAHLTALGYGEDQVFLF